MPPRPLRQLSELRSADAASLYYDQVRKWAAENNIRPKLKIDDHVDVVAWDGGTCRYRGIIVAFKTDIAQYAVSIPDLGHTFDRESRTGDYLSIDYEILEADQRIDQDVPEEGVVF